VVVSFDRPEDVAQLSGIARVALGQVGLGG
jgi:hypothetical protein